MGQTSAGNGQIETFGILTKSAFLNTTPKLAKISYDNVSGNAYSDKYENSVKKDVDASVNRVRNRGIARTNTTKQSKLAQIDATEQQLNIKQSNLNLYKTQLGNNSQIIAAQDMLNQTRNDLKTKRNAIQNNNQQINYKLQSRNDYNSGYNQYGENAKRIDMLSNTFPIIFFLVSLLVCFTTMSRMANEKRTELGTERALGYSKFDTLKIFIVYGLSTGILGSIIGTILGTGFLPKKIFAAYSANFLIPNFQAPIRPFWMIIAIIISIAVTTLPALYSANFELKELPATLMLPKAPKDGTRVLLERIPFIWKRLSFNYKIMFRNLARYKNRMFMAIIGVAGCTALLITGFGIKDSLNSILTNQYQQIVHYDAISIYNPDSSTKDLSNYNTKINQKSGIKDRTKIYYEQVSTHTTDSINDQTVSLLVPKHTQSFTSFVTLKNPETNKKFELPKNGIVITQKLAKLTNKKVGDRIVIKDANGKDHIVKIVKIAQMYAGHDIYMSPSYYNESFSKPISYNANMLKLKNKSTNNVNKVSRNLNRSKSAVTVIQSNDEKVAINNILHGLNNLVIIITFAASLLAFAVLFTLTNINVSERIRELSTIKVLGFYPIEVIMYVYRETFFLTIIGILFGWLGGNYLHRYIMQTLPPDNAMTSINLVWTNPTISAILTIIFSIIVMALMAQKINKIDMLGALKSVD